MTNLEIMERAIKYTTGIYEQVHYTTDVQSGKITTEGLKYYAKCHSAKQLRDTILSEDCMCSAYPVSGNLRQDMANVGRNGLINELLKNIVSVATYYRIKESSIGSVKDSHFRKNMSDDEMTVVIYNNLDYFGPERVYELLENPEALYVACLAFVNYRMGENKGKMDYVSTVDPIAQYLNNKLQQHYEKLESQKVKSLK